MRISTIDGKKLRERKKNKNICDELYSTYTCGLNVILYTSPEAHLLITEEGTYNIGNVLKQLYIHFNKNSSTAKMKYIRKNTMKMKQSSNNFRWMRLQIRTIPTKYTTALKLW